MAEQRRERQGKCRCEARGGGHGTRQNQTPAGWIAPASPTSHSCASPLRPILIHCDSMQHFAPGPCPHTLVRTTLHCGSAASHATAHRGQHRACKVHRDGFISVCCPQRPPLVRIGASGCGSGNYSSLTAPHQSIAQCPSTPFPVKTHEHTACNLITTNTQTRPREGKLAGCV